MVQLRRSEAFRFKERIEEITNILRHRERGAPFEISDHAVIRYLERTKGLDTTAVRAEMQAELAEASQTTKVNGEAAGLLAGDYVYVVARGHLVVTVYPAMDHEVKKTKKRRDTLSDPHRQIPPVPTRALQDW